MFRVVALALFLTASFQTGAQQVPQSRLHMQLSFSPIVKETSPAVVNIYTKTLVRQRRSLFEEMFGNDPFSPFGTGRPRARVENSLGSGVFIQNDGLVVTNAHVIKGATEIEVVTADRRNYRAEVVLEIEDADLAFLRLDTDLTGFPTLELSDTDTLEVGDLVLAIGNPFGVGQTVTSGIVSATGRAGIGNTDSSNLFIQTDAAINPGNSGGALVDMKGELVGINTAIFSRSGGSNGIGFAIPANLLKVYLRDLEAGGVSSAPWIGVKGQELTRELAEGLGIDRSGGVVVSEIFPNGPGDLAGLKQGDVIVAVNGHDIINNRTMSYRIRLADPDEPLRLEVSSAGKNRIALVKPIDPPELPTADLFLVEGPNPLSGATIANLSPKLARDKGMSALWSGVIVDTVYRNSWAAQYGFRASDRILSINGRAVETVEDVRAANLNETRRWNIKKIDARGRTQTMRVAR